MRLAHLSLVAALAGLAGAAVVAVAPTPPRDHYVVRLDAGVRAEPATGRVILFFVDETERRLRHRPPASGPFFYNPQPIASVAVDGLMPGAAVTIDAPDASFPDTLDMLDGRWRVQAVLDADVTERSHLEGPGNCFSRPITVELSRKRTDSVELTLSRGVRAYAPDRDDRSTNIRWVRLRSERLSAFYGRDVEHRAGVAFPLGYFDEECAGRKWPTIYVIPGYGGRYGGASVYADMLRRPGIEEFAPTAVHVVLDPEAPLGHHGFVDSPNLGPRGTALVSELIPYLEREYKLAARPEGRVVTGHSSGGWSSLWLQLRYPDVFGGCWASGPDPVDFSAFQMSDLYRDANLYRDAKGRPQPSYREIINVDADMIARMTVEQEGRMEHAMDPNGGSGQQWDAWEAMFSPRDPESGMPKPMFDARTGRIDHAVMSDWRRFDIAALVEGQWDHYGPIVMDRVHLNCGDRDNFYLERAVLRFKAMVEAQAAAMGGWRGSGYVDLVEFATHATVVAEIHDKVNEEIREQFRAAGLHE